jgi:hypothetical protein
MLSKLIIAAFACAYLSSPAFAQEGSARQMLQRIASLEGEWEGVYEWSGARSGGGELRVMYQVTGLGSAVIETMIQDGRASMSTVYHVDGDDLRMTHYCASQKQSRLRAGPEHLANGAARFEFVDVTNADSSRPGYVTGFSMRIESPDRLTNQFVFEGGAPRSFETITLRRVSSGPASGRQGAVEEHRH